MLAGALLLWKSYRQSIVAQSSAEAELYAAIDAYQVGTGVAELLKEVFGKAVEKELVVDSSATVGILTDSKTTNWRTRHLNIKGAGIREAYQNDDLAISHTSGLTQVAGVLTKALDQNTLLRLLVLLSLVKPATAANYAALASESLPIWTGFGFGVVAAENALVLKGCFSVLLNGCAPCFW